MGNFSEEQKELIEVARLVGLFLDNGFEWNDAGIKVPTSEGYDNVRYLEAVSSSLLNQVGSIDSSRRRKQGSGQVLFKSKKASSCV